MNFKIGYVTLVAVCIVLTPSLAEAQTLTWGSISVNSGPSVYDWQIQDWIDDFFEDGSKGDGTVSSDIVMINTACFGGDFQDNFNSATGDAAGGGAFDTVSFTNTGFLAANSAGQSSYYGGYHDNAAAATQPGNTAQDVVNAGTAGKDPRETPVQFGMNHSLSGTTSTHVLVWAGLPNAQDQTDINNIHNSFTGQANTTVTVLAGNGAGANADGAATQANLMSSLQTIGALMDDGADEHFVMFVTDHGNIEKIDTSKTITSLVSSVSSIFDLGADIYNSMIDDPFNSPTIEIFSDDSFDPFEFDVQLNGNFLGSLGDSQISDFEFPSGLHNQFVFDLGDELFLNGNNDVITLDFTGTSLGSPLTFDILIGSGDIARASGIPEPGSTVLLMLVGLFGLGIRKRRNR